MKNLITLSLLITFLTSCVGTIEESPSKTVTTPAKSEKLNFRGIDDCKAISHDKIEVTFRAADIEFGSVTVDDLIYQAFLDGAFDKASASGRGGELVLDQDGYYHLIVKNLKLATNYKVTVRVIDPISGQSDPNVKICEAKTDDIEKPKFDGLQRVSPYPGVAGENTAYLEWNKGAAGKEILPGIENPEYKIEEYKIYFGESEDNLRLVTSVDRDQTSYDFVPQTDPPGPTLGKTFFFKVNAVDKNGREERNTIIRSLTFEEQENIKFAGIKQASTIHKTEGFSSLSIEWEQASGPFNIYKVFAIPNTDSTQADFLLDKIDSNNSDYLARSAITDLLKTSDTVTGLSQDTEYKIFVIACYSSNNVDCDSTPTIKGDNVSKTATTTPKLKAFGGITEFLQRTGDDSLQSFDLKWNTPSNEGICQDIRIRDVYNDLEDLKLCSNANSDELCYEDTISCLSTGVTIKNAQPEEKYCLEAYISGYGRTQNEDTIVTKCGEIRFNKPIFQGNFLTCNTVSASKIDLNWIEPNPYGIFNNYILFAKEISNENPMEASQWLEAAKVAYAGNLATESSCTQNADSFCAKSIAPEGTLSNQFSDLKPNTTYGFMIKTLAEIDLGSGAEKFWDDNTVLTKCTTGETELEFENWLHIAALGPKFNAETDSIESEVITSADYADGEITNLNLAPAGTAGEGEEGNVYLAFNDLQFSTGKTFEYYLGTELNVASDSTINGYVIFRSTDVFPSDKINELNNIDPDSTSTDWVALNKDNPVRANADGYVEFTDTLSGGIHPIKDNALVSLTTKERGQRGRIVSYAIKPILNGKPVRISNDTASAAIIQIVIPPSNMALLHPIMVNKKYCENLNSQMDLNKNFRCEASGAGAYEDPNDNKTYFEEKKYTLLDRADLGSAVADKPLRYYDNYLESEADYYIVKERALKTDDYWVANFARSYTASLNWFGGYYYGGTVTQGGSVSNDPTLEGWYQGWMNISLKQVPDPVLEPFDSTTYLVASNNDIYNRSTPCNYTDYANAGYDSTQCPTPLPSEAVLGYSSSRVYLLKPDGFCGFSKVNNTDTSSWIKPTSIDESVIEPDYHDIARSDKPANCFEDSIPVTTFYQELTSNGSGSYYLLSNSDYEHFYMAKNKPRGPGQIVDELIPGFQGQFKSAKWMIKNSAIYPKASSNEYFARDYPYNYGNDDYGYGRHLSPGATASEVNLPVSHGHYACQSQMIGLKKGVSYNPKLIRKRNISSKEANYVTTAIAPNSIASGTVLSDQFLCSFNVVDSKYHCDITPDGATISLFESSVNEMLSFPFSAYSSTDTILPDQDIYTNEEDVDLTVELEINTDEGVKAKYASFDQVSTTSPRADINLVSPTDLTRNIRCAIQLEIDETGFLQKVDGRF